jgi:hypothetical protein
MKGRRVLSLCLVTLALTSLVVSCGPAPTPEVIRETVVVEKEVEVTK